ncbi:MAG: hypothetical protein ACREQB_01885 [Candidatus Binataceae bacterium]
MTVGPSRHWRNQMPRVVMNSNHKIRMTIAGAVCIAAALFAPQTLSAHDMSMMNMGHADHDGSMHGAMDPHMRMTALRPSQPADEARAHQIVAALRESLAPYSDYRVALAEGRYVFLEQLPQDEYHFVSQTNSLREYQGHPDLSKPGALLYAKDNQQRYRLVGAMYSAPPNATPEQLDAIVPLGVARWHAHTDICLPQGISLDDLIRGEFGQRRTDLAGLLPIGANGSLMKYNLRFGVFADGRFGFTGKINDAHSCEAAGGDFIAQAWGWMVHVYPFAGDDLKVAFGHKVPAQTAAKD